jgi:hypothetical protein
MDYWVEICANADPPPAWIDDAIEIYLAAIVRFARTLNRGVDAVRGKRPVWAAVKWPSSEEYGQECDRNAVEQWESRRPNQPTEYLEARDARSSRPELAQARMLSLHQTN